MAINHCVYLMALEPCMDSQVHMQHREGLIIKRVTELHPSIENLHKSRPILVAVCMQPNDLPWTTMMSN